MALEKSITLYLSGMQKRILKDTMSAKALKVKSIDKLTKVTIKDLLDHGQLVMYRPRWEAIKVGHELLHLTDEQIAHVSATIGAKVKVSAININPEAITSGHIVFE